MATTLCAMLGYAAGMVLVVVVGGWWEGVQRRRHAAHAKRMGYPSLLDVAKRLETPPHG